MSGFNNYYDDPFSENPFSSHFSSPSNQPTGKFLYYIYYYINYKTLIL